MKKLVLAMTMGTALLLSGLQGGRTDLQFQAAINKETVEGDLKGAIELYKKVAQSTDRAVAAKALVHMGECYEKLGDAEARKAYERVVRDFGDQSEQAAQARTRLASLEHGKASVPSGISVRKVWDDAIDPGGNPSPDGRYLSFTDWSSGDLAIRDLKTGENRRLTKKGSWAAVPDEENEGSVISPDGKLVAFNWFKYGKKEECEIRVIGADGSGDRVLSKKPSYLWPYAWSPDGKSIVVGEEASGRLVLMSVADGSVRELFTTQWRGPRTITFSPDGRYLAFSLRPEKDIVPEDIYVLDLQAPSISASKTKLVDHPADDKLMGWSPDGRSILFQSDRNGSRGAWLLPMQGGRASGPPQLVKPDLATGTSEVISKGFTSNGSLYYALRLRPLDAQVASLDLTMGRLTNPPKPLTNRFSGSTCCPQWSPDGNRVLYEGPNRTIYVRTLDSGEERELLPQLAQTFRPRWHPDGQSLVVTGYSKDNRPGIYRVDLTTGAAGLLAPLETPQPGWISPDGSTLYYLVPSPRQVVARNLATTEERVIYRSDSKLVQNGALSRDGKYLALAIGGSAGRVIVVPTAGGEAKELMKTGLVKQRLFGIDWTPDGKYILATFREDMATKTIDLWRLPVEGGEPQKIASLPPTNYANQASIHMHPDGSRLAITAGHQKFELWAMENFLPKPSASR